MRNYDPACTHPFRTTETIQEGNIEKEVTECELCGAPLWVHYNLKPLELKS